MWLLNTSVWICTHVSALGTLCLHNQFVLTRSYFLQSGPCKSTKNTAASQALVWNQKASSWSCFTGKRILWSFMIITLIAEQCYQHLSKGKTNNFLHKHTFVWFILRASLKACLMELVSQLILGWINLSSKDSAWQCAHKCVFILCKSLLWSALVFVFFSLCCTVVRHISHSAASHPHWPFCLHVLFITAPLFPMLFRIFWIFSPFIRKFVFNQSKHVFSHLSQHLLSLINTSPSIFKSFSFTFHDLSSHLCLSHLTINTFHLVPDGFFFSLHWHQNLWLDW